MQISNGKTDILAKITGEIVQKLREKLTNKTVNKLGSEYDYGSRTLSHIEKGEVEKGEVNCKFVTLWMIAESLGVKTSELVKMIEESLPEDFRLTEE